MGGGEGTSTPAESSKRAGQTAGKGTPAPTPDRPATKLPTPSTPSSPAAVEAAATRPWRADRGRRVGSPRAARLLPLARRCPTARHRQAAGAGRLLTGPAPGPTTDPTIPGTGPDDLDHPGTGLTTPHRIRPPRHRSDHPGTGPDHPGTGPDDPACRRTTGVPPTTPPVDLDTRLTDPGDS